jgi:hypothetical protein
MSADNPPTYYFTGINFNSSFYEPTGTGDLTLAQANSLYLKKTVADTATAIETFSAGIETKSVDTDTEAPLTIGKTNATQIVLGDTANAIPITISGTTNIFIDEVVVDIDAGKKYVTVDKCFFTTGVGDQATIDTKTAIPLHIAPSTAVEPNAICTGVVIGNSTIPISISGSSTTLSSPLTLGSVPSANTQLGFNVMASLNTLNGNALTLNTLSTAMTTASCPIGIYLVNYTLRITATGGAPCNITVFQSFISTSSNLPSGYPLNYGQVSIGTTTTTVPAYINGDNDYFAVNGSAIIRITSAGTFSILYKASATSGISFWNAGTNRPMTYITATRIA